MKRHVGMLVLALLVVAVLLASTVAFKVDSTEYVLVKTFGKTTRLIDGVKEAGLAFKWPWPVQKLVHYDARKSVFEDTSTELQTRDKQNLLLTLYCAWRVADPAKFNASIQTAKAAQERIRDLLRSAKSDVVGRHNLEDFINTDPQKMLMASIEEEILTTVQRVAFQDNGVKVVSVGIKSLGLPESVTQAVIEAMKAERQRDVRRYESSGEAQATAIRERAKAAGNQILEFANRKAAEIRTEGDRAAAGYYREFAKDERFSMFLRSLESLKKELESKSVILLDGSLLPAVGFFQQGPSLKPFDAPVPSAGTSPRTEPSQGK